MRKKRLLYNTGSAFLVQFISIICGFIIPRCIMGQYGSAVNGLINSITSFIAYISFLELGVGAVIQAAMYVPLADNDNEQISKVMASAQKFFSTIAKLLLAYIAVLVVVYPVLIDNSFDHLYSATLILVISASYFAQYYFGMSNIMLLHADQRSYVLNGIQCVTLIINVVVCVVLMSLGYGIHMVKLVSSSIFFARPLLIKTYVDKHYKIDRNISYSEEPIKQKWNGFAQHVLVAVLDYTDIVALTVFSTFANISIYSTYHLIVCGVKQIFSFAISGVQSLLGELWAKKEFAELNEAFSWIEWLLHTFVVFAFGCTFVLICPFVKVYTKGINDANYIVPVFASIITLANAAHSLRLPYLAMVFAGGHFKETQKSFVVAAAINIIISVLAVSSWGLVGVAVGTLFAMAYQTFWLARYVSNHLIKWPFKKFIKQVSVDILIWVVGYFSTCWLSLSAISYAAWVFMAVKVSVIWIIICISINYVCYKSHVSRLLTILKLKLKLHKT